MREKRNSFTHRVCKEAVNRTHKDFELSHAFSFLANTREAVVVVDAQQRIVLWNFAAHKLVGYHPAEVIGKHCYTVLRARDHAGCAVCSKDCETHRAAAAGTAVTTRNLLIESETGAFLRVSAITVVFPHGWLAHFLIDENKQ
jgi:PAS domain-containing protein